MLSDDFLDEFEELRQEINRGIVINYYPDIDYRKHNYTRNEIVSMIANNQNKNLPRQKACNLKPDTKSITEDRDSAEILTGARTMADKWTEGTKNPDLESQLTVARAIINSNNYVPTGQNPDECKPGADPRGRLQNSGNSNEREPTQENDKELKKQSAEWRNNKERVGSEHGSRVGSIGPGDKHLRSES
ncbi:hypothetical protein BDP27DRAFT_1363260 [Rhodocollybia butyracea]|uniref:Uncharacterized protein n=1 Tax=Rhodocollybia butyracea TaxID=206335 RepID=A0A9P5PP74_9AGAR|nr:hypothetical protein BDP27DRAFT_1363260 [Rhodocollybia butyracea]